MMTITIMATKKGEILRLEKIITKKRENKQISQRSGQVLEGKDKDKDEDDKNRDK